MELQTTKYCLLESASSVEDFLKSQFKQSNKKIKKYFDKSFLNKSLSKGATLDLPLNFINDGEINPNYSGNPLEIISEDDFFFVFTKNTNQFIHPLTYEEKNNCLSYLREIKPALLNVNKKNYDRGLLYRLDYETSGIVIYVKDEVLYTMLRKNFFSLIKEKKYLCWVHGEMNLSGKMTHYFESREEKGKRVVVSTNPPGEIGELFLKPLYYDEKNKITKVEVLLQTGLRHQIRSQLAYLGFPLVGDLFYGGKPASRLYLHALSYHLQINKKDYFWESVPCHFNGL